MALPVFALSILLVVALGLIPLGVIATNTSENQGHLTGRSAEYATDKLEQLLGRMTTEQVRQVYKFAQFVYEDQEPEGMDAKGDVAGENATGYTTTRWDDCPALEGGASVTREVRA